MHIAIVGTGYVGLTTGVGLATLGHRVICVDALPERVAAIQAGRPPFFEKGLPEALERARTAGHIEGTTDLNRAVRESDLTMIAVGTPFKGERIDLSDVAAAARAVGSALRQVRSYHVVAVKSTVVPGTTESVVRLAVEETSGRAAGDFGLCMNPEFLREGSALDDFLHPDRIVIGQWDEKSGEMLGELYRGLNCPVLYTSLRNAEMIKYAANSLLATLISFSNELAALCEATPGTDIQTVMQGVHLDRRLSLGASGERIHPGILSFLAAGCGFGGSCLPKDLNALRAFATERGVNPALLHAVAAVNTKRPLRLVEMAEEVLGSLRGARVALLGLAFKPGTGDLRDSPALTIAHHLLEKGAAVRAYDPLVDVLPACGNGSEIALCRAPAEVLRDADVALVATACPEFVRWEWSRLCGLMRQPLIIDGRDALRNVAWPKDARYLPIGRAVEDGNTPDEHRFLEESDDQGLAGLPGRRRARRSA
jgi:UDPglucose 6-dehydrogenase/GDP-mannose 6-dehydrogenase